MTHFGDIQRLTDEIEALKREIALLTALVNGLAGQISVLGMQIAPPTLAPGYPYPSPGQITIHTPEQYANTQLGPAPAQGPVRQQPLRAERGSESGWTPKTPYAYAAFDAEAHFGRPDEGPGLPEEVTDGAAPGHPPTG